MGLFSSLFSVLFVIVFALLCIVLFHQIKLTRRLDKIVKKDKFVPKNEATETIIAAVIAAAINQHKIQNSKRQ